MTCSSAAGPTGPGSGCLVPAATYTRVIPRHSRTTGAREKFLFLVPGKPYCGVGANVEKFSICFETRSRANNAGIRACDMHAHRRIGMTSACPLGHRRQSWIDSRYEVNSAQHCDVSSKFLQYFRPLMPSMPLATRRVVGNASRGRKSCPGDVVFVAGFPKSPTFSLIVGLSVW